MYGKQFALVFILLYLISCSLLKDEEVIPRLVWPDSVKTITISGRTIKFTVTCMIPTPCYDYYNYEEERDGNHYFIRFYAKHDAQTICPQVISSLEAYYNKTVPQNGAYSFHFIRSDSTSLDTMITIHE